mmetsp:Transcript_44182/g.127608  ORF Transcript_44182/g.127608 Transcript_44182/m.127608 type:complete len:205 (+) Transcript_44182:752-1366(+)
MSSWTKSTCGSAVTMPCGLLRSRKPSARVTGTASKPMPLSLGNGAVNASNASSIKAEARAASGCARRPSAKTPNFANAFFFSSAFFAASSASSASRNAWAQARGITALVTLPAACKSLCNLDVPAASASQSASIRSTAVSILAKASFARSLRSSGALSGCTLRASRRYCAFAALPSTASSTAKPNVAKESGAASKTLRISVAWS